jgi:DnaK suppressor protein
MLDDAKLAELRDALRALREELVAYEEASRAGAQPVDLEEPIGRLTRIDAIQQQKLTQVARARSEVRLKQVDAALRRLESGTYGTCGRCGDDIEIERLRARPEAPICLTCQEELEQEG